MSEALREPESAASDEEALLSKLNQLDECLDKFAKARRLRALCSGIGVVLILLLLCLFGWNLWTFGKGHLSPEGQQAFVSQLQADMTTLYQTDSDIAGIIDDFRNDVAPFAVDHVRSRLQEEIPRFQGSAMKSLSDLQTYVAVDTRDRFNTALAEALAEFEIELMQRFPDLKRQELHEGLAAMHDLLITDLSALVNERLRDLEADFNALTDALDAYQDLPEAKRLDPDNPDLAKLNVLESLLDLAIFEVNPNRGLVPARVGEGGAQ